MMHEEEKEMQHDISKLCKGTTIIIVVFYGAQKITIWRLH